MNRPPKQPDRSEVAVEERADYDAVVARMRRQLQSQEEADQASVEDFFNVGDYFGALLTSPPLCGICAQMGTFVRTAGNRDNSYSHADREFVDQVLSADWKTNVVQDVHIPDAVGSGVRIEAIEALLHGHEQDLNPDEALLARYIRQVVSGTVDDETYGQIEDRLGSRGLVEYTGFVLWLQWIIRMMQALGTHTISDEEVDQIVAELKAGETGFAEKLKETYGIKEVDYKARLA
jgi:hypothetical protein